MSFSALALLITAGFIHAGWNIVAKQAGGDARFALFTSLFLAVVWLLSVYGWRGMWYRAGG